ncbi:MAG: glycine oxidase ThiO [Gammaproteobacteria bacterium]|nr:glycine oxidase ThiO [Gammaproteobacteria bacterium]
MIAGKVFRGISVTGSKTEIVVVGGGIMGLLSARELALGGARVTLVERGECGRESSWAGGGIVSPLYPWRYREPIHTLARWSQAHYPALVEQLERESGINAEWQPSGMLMLDVKDRTEALAWADAHDQAMQQLEAAQLPSVEPALASGRHGLWMPDIGQVRNPRLVRAARQALAGHGIELREHTEVEGLIAERGQLRGIHTSQGDIYAQHVVVAGGAWSGRLLQDLGLTIDIRPVKGQMILYRTQPGTIQRIVLKDGKYVIPRRDGHVLAGSTMENTDFDKTTTEQAQHELRQAAEALFPVLADAPLVKHWAGLRPGSPEGIPYIGEYPTLRGLFVNAGHFRNGVVMGPASARLLADLVLERKTIVDSAPYALEASR